MQKIIWLAAAGAAGALARYGLAGWVQQRSGAWFPWGTAAVNLAGCACAGLFWGWIQERLNVPGEVRAVVLIGFFGAFTTFSALMLETTALLQDGEWLRAAGNLVLQNGLGLILFFGGLALGRLA